jgi:hypothetical protein
MIESLDNANNMVALNMWEPLLELLDSPHDPIVAHTAWIIGTAQCARTYPIPRHIHHETYFRPRKSSLRPLRIS